MVTTAGPPAQPRTSSDMTMGFIGEHRIAVRPCKDNDKEWLTLEPLEYQAKEQRFVVPPELRTDFASVPRPFVWFIPRYGRYTAAAILHDYLCRVEVPRGMFRTDADGIFRQAMRLLGVPFLRRWIMWTGVRLGALLSAENRRGWGARGSWRVLPFILIALPVVLPAAAVIVLTIPVLYFVERVVWVALLLAERVRKQPTKQINPPSLRLTT
jgi:hypothetical protein